MAYYHRKDNGSIIWLKFPRLWEIKCSNCKKKWAFYALLSPLVPKDMIWVKVKKQKSVEEITSEFSKKKVWIRRIAMVLLIGSTFLAAYIIRGIS